MIQVGGGGDDLNWTRNRGSTPSSGTGPSNDFDPGNGKPMQNEQGVRCQCIVTRTLGIRFLHVPRRVAKHRRADSET